MTEGEELKAQLPEGMTKVFRFARRTRTMGGSPRMYLYDENCEKLLIAAQRNKVGPCHYMISKVSTSFESDDPNYLGICNYSTSSHTFTEVGPDGKTIIFKLSFSGHDRKQKFNRALHLEIPYLEGEIVQEELSKADEMFPDFEFVESEKNFIFTLNGNHLFSFLKVNKDEARFSISSPLSIYDGFKIAIALGIKIEKI